MSKTLDVTKQLTLLDGTPITIKAGAKESLVTLKYAMVEALLHPENDGPATTGEMKLTKFLLATRIHKAEGNVELDNDEIKLVEACVSKVFHTIIVGQVLQHLK